MAQAQTAPAASSIVVEGNRRVEADTVRSYFKLAPGERLDAAPAANVDARTDRIITLILLLVAAALRLALLTEHPGVFGDEGERGMEARHILEGARPPVAGYGWWGVPNLYFYFLAVFLKVAGDDLFALRLSSVACGVAAVFFVARTGRLLFGPRAGWIAGSLQARMVRRSRFGLRDSSSCFGPFLRNGPGTLSRQVRCLAEASTSTHPPVSSC